MELHFGKTSLSIRLEEGYFIPKAPKEHEQVSEDTTSHLHFYEQKGELGIRVIFIIFYFNFYFGTEAWKTGGSSASNCLKLFDHKM